VNPAEYAGPRDFTYIKPTKRRLSEYEALTCNQQPDANIFDGRDGFILSAAGKKAWPEESTRIRYPNWTDFRDPAAMWQRPYVRMQGEQERSIAHFTETAAASGALLRANREWNERLIAGHYRIWSFFEYGLFRGFAPASREALCNELGTVYCLESFDRMRHAQAVVLHLMALENAIEGFSDAGAKERWTTDEIYQPARRLVEQLITTEDWIELGIATNLVVDPIVSAVAVRGLIEELGPHHGDVVAPLIAMTAERDQKRNLDWTLALVKLVTAEKAPEAAANLQCIQEWIDKWTPRAIEAALALEPVYTLAPVPAVEFAEILGRAMSAQAEVVESLGLTPVAGE